MDKALKTQAEIVKILTEANNASFTPARVTGGCGRAYVVMATDKATTRQVDNACAAVGLKFLAKAYGTAGNAIYIGYDNADGRALAKSQAFADVLNAAGLRCYADAVGD